MENCCHSWLFNYHTRNFYNVLNIVFHYHIDDRHHLFYLLCRFLFSKERISNGCLFPDDFFCQFLQLDNILRLCQFFLLLDLRVHLGNCFPYRHFCVIYSFSLCCIQFYLRLCLLRLYFFLERSLSFDNLTRDRF